MREATAHLWITGPTRAARQAAAAALPFPDPVGVDCHRGLRGPYTGAGELMRHLVPRAHARGSLPEGGTRLAILAAAPELRALLGAAEATLTSAAPPGERTRWYGHERTRRIANGLVDHLAAHPCPLTLVFHDVHEADATDAEFLAIALRRLDPDRVRIVVCSDDDTPERPASPGAPHTPGSSLAPATAAELRRRAERRTAPEVTAPYPSEFVDTDGTGEPDEVYRRLDPAARAKLHDSRADELEASHAWSWRLGAIPYHRAHGSSPEAAHAAHERAVEYCLGMGYYTAALELNARMDELLGPDAPWAARYRQLRQRGLCLALLDRPAEAEAAYYDVLSRTTDPKVHTTVSYALSVLFTRLYDAPRKDHVRALAHINTAIAFIDMLPDAEDRAFHTAFMHNGKALVTMHLGDLAEALRLVDTALAAVEDGLPPGRHQLHKSVLHHNRAQLLARLGRGAEALAEYDAVVAQDPHHPEYRFDRAVLHHQQGRFAQALADYAEVERISPPFAELHYNRGDLYSAAGGGDAAAEFARALELEPARADARIALAELWLDEDRAAEAAALAREGLELAPDDPLLHCVHGTALLALGTADTALDSLGRALALAPTAEAYATRASAHLALGHHEEALRDLTAALALCPEDPDLLHNRGYVHESAGQWAKALDDYTRALELPGADREALEQRRAECRERIEAPGSGDLS
ncbi:tetratricopeptide repeat protein [Streptomyces crystallinus]|uniref:Tetratricopeptide repeat protein n=1 Tax=Streptomyces crystallinus TaxID=68191 RepID=A0ABN1FS40_9ACTN